MKASFGLDPRVVGVSLVALVLPSLSIAESVRSGGWFIEASVAEINAAAQLSEFTVDGDDSGLTLGAGYAFNPYFELQAAYHDLGRHAATDCPPPRLCIIANADSVEFNAFSVTAQATWPVSGYVDLYAKTGLMRWDADFAQFDRDDIDTDVVYGAGIGMRFAENWRMNVEYSDADPGLETYGVGMQYRFR